MKILQIFEAEDHVVILTEMVHDARIVPLDGRTHAPKAFGTGATPAPHRALQPAGRRHAALHVHRRRPCDLHSAVHRRHPMTRSPDPIFEYACHEGNYGMANMLRVGRAEDAAAGAAGAR